MRHSTVNNGEDGETTPRLCLLKSVTAANKVVLESAGRLIYKDKMMTKLEFLIKLIF